MMDFYEGWELRNRLIEDGFLTPSDNIAEGKEMDLKIEDLAREHYNWEAAEPSNEKVTDQYRESLMQQTANDRIAHIWEIAIDWDGYRTIRGLGNLLDEIIGCTQVEVKTEHQVLNEIATFNKYKDCNEFLNARSAQIPYYWSFPSKEWKNVENWCNNNNYVARFLCLNHDSEGQTVAVALKIDRKDNKNGTI